MFGYRYNMLLHKSAVLMQKIILYRPHKHFTAYPYGSLLQRKMNEWYNETCLCIGNAEIFIPAFHMMRYHDFSVI